jgi:hypothetical protein
VYNLFVIHWGSRLAIPGIALAAGCAQIFGIDETTALPDAGPAGLRLSFQRTYVGATIVDEPIDMTQATATFLIVDPADPSGFRRVTPTPETNQVLYGDVPPGSDAQVMYTLPDDTVTRIWKLPAPTVTGLYLVHGHPNAEPAPAGATLDFSFTLDAGYATGQALQAYTIGSWTARGFPGTELPAPDMGITAVDPPPYVFDTSNSLTGRPHERLRTDDAVLVLKHAGPTLTGVLTATPFDQTGGDQVTGTMTGVPADQALMITVMPTAQTPRFAQTRPVMANLGMSWALDASPGGTYGSNLGPRLSSGGVLETDTGMIMAMYPDPFAGRGWPAVLTWATYMSRTYTPPMPLPAVGLSTGLYTIATPSAGLALDLPQGLPITITVAGTALTTDGMTLAIDRSGPIDVNFVTDRATCDLYVATFYELVEQAGALVYTERMNLLGTEPQWTIPGDTITTGVMYTVRAQCIRGGYPMLAAGDLTERTLPVHVGYLDSGVFTVMP